jgi:histidinol-phosphatase (PHP family)
MIDEHFAGDGMAFAKEYYRQLAWLPDYAPVDIIGHFDLVTKHRDSVKLFDSDSKEYRYAAIEAAEALAGRVRCFEVNSGAMVRGLRTTPYPDPFIIKEMKRLGFGVVITSDCHIKERMDAFFEESKALLRECGYTERQILTKDGFVPVPL